MIKCRLSIPVQPAVGCPPSSIRLSCVWCKVEAAHAACFCFVLQANWATAKEGKGGAESVSGTRVTLQLFPSCCVFVEFLSC